MTKRKKKMYRTVCLLLFTSSKEWTRHFATATQYDEIKGVQSKLDALEKPVEPTNCCGTGCANCVWLTYLDDLETFHKKEHKLRQHIAQLKDEVAPKQNSTPDLSEVVSNDPALSMFLKLERELAEKKKKKNS
mmetsp:Transcript_17593/g.26184  ORF Transcript_17593/g.26184 Transcript_17593/m.26184 type:complete len:133 (+) Transcript_17593:123-521(+)